MRFRFQWDMDVCIQDKLRGIEVPRGFMSRTKEVDQSLLDKVGTCNGQIGWLGGNGRDDVTFEFTVFEEFLPYARESMSLRKQTVCSGILSRRRVHLRFTNLSR